MAIEVEEVACNDFAGESESIFLRQILRKELIEESDDVTPQSPDHRRPVRSARPQRRQRVEVDSNLEDDARQQREVVSETQKQQYRLGLQ